MAGGRRISEHSRAGLRGWRSRVVSARRVRGQRSSPRLDRSRQVLLMPGTDRKAGVPGVKRLADFEGVGGGRGVLPNRYFGRQPARGAGVRTGWRDGAGEPGEVLARGPRAHRGARSTPTTGLSADDAGWASRFGNLLDVPARSSPDGVRRNARHLVLAQLHRNARPELVGSADRGNPPRLFMYVLAIGPVNCGSCAAATRTHRRHRCRRPRRHASSCSPSSPRRQGPPQPPHRPSRGSRPSSDHANTCRGHGRRQEARSTRRRAG